MHDPKCSPNCLLHLSISLAFRMACLLALSLLLTACAGQLPPGPGPEPPEIPESPEGPERPDALEDPEPLGQPQGNTNGNLSNVGLFAEVDGWIYYSNFDDHQTLYKIRSDFTGKAKLSDDPCRSIQVVDDWVYYASGPLFKVKTDGSQRQPVLSDVVGAFVLDQGWVYYVNQSDGSRLYKATFEGQDRQKLDEDRCAMLNLSGDWLYFLNRSDQSRIYRLKTDGTEKQLLSDHVSHMLIAGDSAGPASWVYYARGQGYDGLYKMRPDGAEPTLLVDAPILSLNVSEPWLFFLYRADHDLHLGKIKSDGSERSTLKSGVISGWTNPVWLLKDWVLFYHEVHKIHQIKPDGTALSPLIF